MPQNRAGELNATTLEAFETRLAVRDVGHRAARGISREDILVEYPDLRDQDIELAKRIVIAPGSRNESFDDLAEIDGTRFRRRSADSHQLKIWEFDRWVSENKIPEKFEYSKGWWDYVELVRRLATRCDADDVRVIGHYIIDTPPPCERLPMPTVAITLPSVAFALRFDFGSWSLKHREICEWVVSVARRSRYVGPLFGLFDDDEDLRTQTIEGLSPDYLFGSYRQNQARFSCLVRDEWDVATLLRILSHEV
jgi:Protein of unknown function (DUF433)